MLNYLQVKLFAPPRGGRRWGNLILYLLLLMVLVTGRSPVPTRAGTAYATPSGPQGQPAAPFPGSPAAPTSVHSTLMMPAVPGTPGISGAADWLLSQQDASGGYPWTPGGAVTDNTQGPSARGALWAYRQTTDPTYLTSALATGAYLVPDYPRLYGDGDPWFAAHDPLFLEELSQVSGDVAYAAFVQTYFWDKLSGGTYGAANDMDAAGFGAYVVNARDSWGQVALSPWDLSATAIAAHVAGETAIRDALMASILEGLNRTSAGDTFDVLGLAGAVWAAAATGTELDPTSGVYAADDSTADLAARLAGWQQPVGSEIDGAWLWNTTDDPADSTNADLQSTAFAVLALHAQDPVLYADNIARGAGFLRALQQSSGQLLLYPGSDPNGSGGVEVHGEALTALATVAPDVVYVDDDWATGLEWSEDPDGTGPATAFGYDAFATVSNGVDGVAPAGTVHVAAGTYFETLSIEKSLTLQGEDQTTTFIDGTGTTSVPLVTINNMESSDHVILDGLTFQNAQPYGTYNQHVCVVANGGAAGSRLTMTHNRLIGGFTDGRDFGLIMQNAETELLFTHNIVSNFYWEGILLENSLGRSEIAWNDVTVYADPYSAFIVNMAYERGGNTNSVTTLQSVHDNVIDANGGSGIIFISAFGWSYNERTGGLFSNVDIADNTITNVGGKGIQLETDGDGGGFVGTRIAGNTLVGQASAATTRGIRTLAAVTDTHVISNSITGFDQGFYQSYSWGQPGATPPTGTTLHHNRIEGNGTAIESQYASATYPESEVDAEDNWFGCNYGPGATGLGCDGTTNPVADNVDADPWLVLDLETTPATILESESADLTADLSWNSDGIDTSPAGHVPDGILTSFAASPGTVSPAITVTTSGLAHSTFTPLTDGIAVISTTVDSQTVTATIVVDKALEYLYLPLILNNHATAPDLVVETVQTGGELEVVIANRGTAPVQEAFWVDLYVNPDPPPTGVNQVWQTLSDHGIAWGVTQALDVDEVLTLTVGGPYYSAAYSDFAGLSAGDELYVQVDSAYEGRAYGGVQELHELMGQPYNNIFGPVTISAQVDGTPGPQHRSFGSVVLPPR